MRRRSKVVLSIIDMLPALPISILDLGAFPPLIMTDILVVVVFICIRRYDLTP